jgi:cardiolipin synthase
MLKRIPNILTITRFFLIPAIVVFILKGHYVGAIIVLTISGITDILDGFIARKFNLITDFGKLADPLADKSTQLAILITLSILEIFPLWILLVVLLKEFIMIAGVSFLYGKEIIVSSKWYGKLATVLFYIAIVSSLFVMYWNNILSKRFDFFEMPFFDTYIYYLAIFVTLFASLMYLKVFYLQGYFKKGKS